MRSPPTERNDHGRRVVGRCILRDMIRSLARTSMLAALVLTLASACSSSSKDSTTVACRQKATADGDSDCAGRGSKTRKLDCDTQAGTDQALAAGCELEKVGDKDVCCPTTVSGTPPTTSTLPCTEPADTLTDSDCAGTSQPRKLDCATTAEQAQGIALGCRKETPTDALDLCCPEAIRGVH
jgi:hypothetical protein